jgi:hypothetical protein
MIATADFRKKSAWSGRTGHCRRSARSTKRWLGNSKAVINTDPKTEMETFPKGNLFAY